MNLREAILQARRSLSQFGEVVATPNWQGIAKPFNFLEVINESFVADIPNSVEEVANQCQPFMPWADIHFQERVSGIAYNPPPSHTLWLKGNEESLKNGRFSHTYPERMHKNLFVLVELLKQDPHTRQAYLPIWFPEDIELSKDKERVPCTLGWHFLLRKGKLHCFYPMRSCDALRHFHNDVYFAARLTLWLIEKANLDAEPGTLAFHASSFHCFVNDEYALKRSLK